MKDNDPQPNQATQPAAPIVPGQERKMRPLSEASGAEIKRLQSIRRKQWYVVRVQEFHEKDICKRFAKAGIRHFLPVRKERHKWSDRYKMIDVVLSAGYVFVYMTPATRNNVFTIGNRYVLGFLVAPGTSTPAVVPNVTMASFISAVKSEKMVKFDASTCKRGDKFLILRGPSRGLVGECIDTLPGKKVLQLSLIGTLSASFEVEVDNVVPYEEGQGKGYIDSYYAADEDDESWFVEQL